MTVLGQPRVTYTYDNADGLTQLTQGTSAVSLAYDPANRRTSLPLPQRGGRDLRLRHRLPGASLMTLPPGSSARRRPVGR